MILRELRLQAKLGRWVVIVREMGGEDREISG
jgi:hypothetical protein